MAFPSVTYTFSNSTTADATQVNQNFTDIINGLSDGTKNLSMSAGTFAGTLSVNGNVTLGLSNSNTLTLNAILASAILFSTQFSFDIGSSTVGVKSVYFGDSGATAHGTRLIGGSTSANLTFTLPTSLGTSSQSLKTDGAGVMSWSWLSVTGTKTTTYTAQASDDVILVSGASGAWSLALPAASSSTGKVYRIKRTDNTPANAVTIDPNASETIDGATTRALYTQYESIEIACDGSNWHVTDHKCDTSFTSYTPTFTGFGTVSTQSFAWRRIGDSVHVIGNFTVGTPTAAEARISLPTGMTISSPLNVMWTAGKGNYNVQSSGSISINATGGNTYVTYGSEGSAATDAAMGSDLGNDTFSAGNKFTMSFTVPISGWFA